MDRQQAEREFYRLCIEACRALDKAAQIAILNGMSDVDVAKATAAAGLAGVGFHKISRHGADARDYELIQQDLAHIARKVEPLIEAIGSMAQQNTHGAFDESGFKEVIQTGMENAVSELRWAAGRSEEDRLEAAE